MIRRSATVDLGYTSSKCQPASQPASLACPLYNILYKYRELLGRAADLKAGKQKRGEK